MYTDEMIEGLRAEYARVTAERDGLKKCFKFIQEKATSTGSTELQQTIAALAIKILRGEI